MWVLTSQSPPYCRDLQLPARIAEDWPAQREALLQSVANALGASSSGGHMTTGGSGAAADAAAADRAMRELLVL